MEYCELCLKDDIYRLGELHHIIFRSEVKPLENCKLNHIYLCSSHHRGTYGVHGKLGDKLNHELKLKLQNDLEILFCQNNFTLEDVQAILGISLNATKRLSKHFEIERGKYTRESIIRASVGGKLILEGD